MLLLLAFQQLLDAHSTSRDPDSEHRLYPILSSKPVSMLLMQTRRSWHAPQRITMALAALPSFQQWQTGLQQYQIILQAVGRYVSLMQAWRVCHQPQRRTKRGTPKVHSGFYRAWRRNGFDQTVSDRIDALIEGGEVDLDTVRVYITGVPIPELDLLTLIVVPRISIPPWTSHGARQQAAL